jgi:hypothetical protein
MKSPLAGFWLWSLGVAFCTAAAIVLDIVLIAIGALPTAPGLLLTFAIPTVAGFALGSGNRSSGAARLLLMAGVIASGLYSVMVAVAIVGVATSSNVSCVEPNAPWNCDNDIGAAAGLLIAMPLAIGYGMAAWFGSLVGGTFARRL